MDFCRDLSAPKIRIGAVAALLLLTFFAIGLPLLITPQSELGDIDEDCGSALSGQSRRICLRLHNKYRSKAAKGEYILKNNWSEMKVLSPATRMLQKYDCSLERSALKHAYNAQGKMIHSAGVLEKICGWVQEKYLMNMLLRRAIKSWGDEIMHHGIKKFSERAGITGRIGHATQMLWHKTRSVGCGIIYTTNGRTSVVCQYHSPEEIFAARICTKPSKPYRTAAKKGEVKCHTVELDYVNYFKI